ncbi:hypothetical protein Ancab_036304 [Ancistrocladus abbreviatus]
MTGVRLLPCNYIIYHLVKFTFKATIYKYHCSFPDNFNDKLYILQYVSNQKAMEKLGDADGLTVEKVDEVIKEFLVDVKHDQIEKKGWPKLFSAYKVSKAAINAYTRILAKKYPNISVNAVHPGYVKTDFNLNVGTVTVKEGARGPVMLALMPDGGPTGLFFDKTERSTF